MRKNYYLAVFFALIATVAVGQKTEKIDIREASFIQESLNIPDFKTELLTYPVPQNGQRAMKQKLDSNIIFSEQGGYPLFKEEDTYNSSNLVEISLNKYWDLVSWIPSTKWEYSYFPDSIHILITEWDSVQWVPSTKWEYTYNPNGLLDKSVKFIMDTASGQWVNFYKLETGYDASGNLINGFGYTWDVNASQWNLYAKGSRTYNAAGHIVEDITSQYNMVTGQIEKFKKLNYFYIGSVILDYRIEQEWDLAENQWVNIEKQKYFYDAASNLSQVESLEWDGVSSVWSIFKTRDYLHDNNWAFADLILPFNYVNRSGNFNHMLLSEKIKKLVSGTWINTFRAEYYYSDETVTSIAELESNAFNLYPNPVANYLNVRMEGSDVARLELFDIQGKLVLQKSVRNGARLDIERLTSGIYLYRISVDGRVKHGKLIKE